MLRNGEESAAERRKFDSEIFILRRISLSVFALRKVPMDKFKAPLAARFKTRTIERLFQTLSNPDSGGMSI